MHGRGRYAFANGFVYAGEYRAGKESGHGRYAHADGRQWYEGQWADGVREGAGRSDGPEGAYVGQWRAGKREGDGRLEYAGGDVYDGQWRAGVRQGRGRYVRASGETAHDGEWRAGKVVANSRTKL
jgi:hypothetical protein